MRFSTSSSLLHVAGILVAALLLAASCSRKQEDAPHELTSDPVSLPPLTCVVADRDSDALLLGSKAPRFSRLSLADGSREDFPLPEFTDNAKTYDIHRLSDSEWLVAKRNCGLVFVAYEYGPDGRHISHTARVTTPAEPLPSKETRFSVYSIVESDSLIALGSSNGLIYLTAADIARLRTDSLVEARHAQPLVHLRKNQLQFSQESMFRQGDSLLTATDKGIYRLAFRDFGNPSAHYETFSDNMRCWNATLRGDTLAVIHTPAGDTHHRELTLFSSSSGRRISSRPVPASSSWVGLFADSLRCFGEEGDFLCFRSAATIDRKLYFIKDGALRVCDADAPRAAGSERISFCSGNYAISDRQGLFRIDGQKPEFLGDITGVSGIRSMAASGKSVYIATSDGVYAVDGSDFLFSTPRKARLIEENNTDKDRVESVLALGDTLLVGTRCGLHALSGGSRVKDYSFPELKARFESPYVAAIARDDKGYILLHTLNFGTWTLPSLSAESALRSQLPFPATSLPDMALTRDVTSWHDIWTSLILILLLLLAATGVGAILYTAIRRRHMQALRKMQTLVNDKERENIRNRQEMEQMRKDREEFVLKASRSISIDPKEISDAICNALPLFDGNAAAVAVSSRLKSCLDDITPAIDSDNPEVKERAKNAYRSLDDFCTDSISRALALAGIYDPVSADCPAEVSAKESSCNPMGAALKEFSLKIDGLSLPFDKPLDVRLRWLANAWGILGQTLSDLQLSLDDDISGAGAVSPKFRFDDLVRVWDTWVAPWAKPTRLTVIDGFITSDHDPVDIRRTIVLTSVSFFGCSYPRLDIKNKVHITEADRGIVNIPSINNMGNLGTAFKFWAYQLTKEAFAYGDATFPAAEGDVLWILQLRNVHYTKDATASDSLKDSLAAGIRIAFCDMYDLPVPQELLPLLQPKRPGRPKKKVSSENPEA